MDPSETQHAPLLIYTTHPRVFFHLAFLVSAVAMRDATGRRPKPKVFATEGLAVCERERPKEGQKAIGRCESRLFSTPRVRKSAGWSSYWVVATMCSFHISTYRIPLVLTYPCTWSLFLSQISRGLDCARGRTSRNVLQRSKLTSFANSLGSARILILTDRSPD